jgi:hypothetical protein
VTFNRPPPSQRLHPIATPRHQIYRPTPKQNTTTDTIVAKVMAITKAQGINSPNIPMLVSVANTPPAGVNPPYIAD